MKCEKGITLAALIIYVIMFSLILGVLVSLSSYIYGRMQYVSSDSYSSEEFNKFNISFIKDIKQSTDARIETPEYDSTGKSDVTIILSNGVNYNYISNEHAIYRNKVKIAEKISVFSAEKMEVTKNVKKNVIRIMIGTGRDNAGKNDVNFGKTIKYVLKYW